LEAKGKKTRNLTQQFIQIYFEIFDELPFEKNHFWSDLSYVHVINTVKLRNDDDNEGSNILAIVQMLKVIHVYLTKIQTQSFSHNKETLKCKSSFFTHPW
jgi:hypothetical protein